MKENYFIQLLVTFSSIGLGIAMIPEIYKVIKEPKSVRGLSPLFLILRAFFFILLATALFIKNDEQVLTLAYLSVWYILCYIFLLIMYYRQYKTNL